MGDVYRWILWAVIAAGLLYLIYLFVKGIREGMK
jgi:hypothetical protein